MPPPTEHTGSRYPVLRAYRGKVARLGGGPRSSTGLDGYPCTVRDEEAHRQAAPAPLPPPTVVLASSSPRRADLLSALDVEFEVLPADVDEAPLAGETPPQLAQRLAESKAAKVAKLRPDALVLAADTVVALGDEMLEKPRDEAENGRFIARLAGRSHEVFTGHALRLRGVESSWVVRSVVTFRALEAGEVARYAASGEGLDKAGGYALQGRGGMLVERIEGCYSSIVGLSLPTLVVAARRLGVTLV